jgi:transmembrane protein EpsG
MLLAIVLSFIIPYRKGNTDKNYKLLYCIVFGVLLFLIAGLRSKSVGIDSEQYAWHFYEAQKYSFNEILSVYPKAPGFYLFLKILSIITKNHQILYIVSAGIFSISISQFIYKYSKDAMISFIMLITASYFAFTLSGLRQTIAIAIAVISINYIIERKFLKYIVLMFIAAIFHKSIILFVPVYFLYDIKINKITITLSALFALVILAIRKPLILLASNYIFEDFKNSPITETSGGWKLLIVFVMLIIAILILKNKEIATNKSLSLFVSMLYIGAVIQLFVPLQPNTFRMALYFSITSIVLIPEIIHSTSDKILRTAFYSVFLILFAVQYYVFTFYDAGANPYFFFWQ